jgi:hypothetical protein
MAIDPSLAQAADELDHQNNVQTATQYVGGAQGVNVDDAVQAIRHAPSFGIPPAAVMQDPKPVVEAAQRQADQAALQHPAVAAHVASDPVKAAASKDDLQGLASVAQHVWDGFATINGNPAKDFWSGVTAAGQTVLNDAAQIKNNIGRPSFQSQLNTWTGLARLPWDATFGAMLAGPVAMAAQPIARGQEALGATLEEAQHNVGMAFLALGAEGGRVGGPLRGGGLRPEGVPGAPRISAPTRLISGPPTTVAPAVDPMTGGTVADPHGFISGANGKPASFPDSTSARAWMDAHPDLGLSTQDLAVHPETGEIGIRAEPEPTQVAAPPGVDPVADTGYKAQAQSTYDFLKSLEEKITATKTQERSPELMASFLDEHVAPGQLVQVDPVPWAEEAEKTGQAPYDTDPAHSKIYAALSSAYSNGIQAQIPLGQFMAATAGQPWADAMFQAASVPGGISSVEAKALPTESAVDVQKLSDLWKGLGTNTNLLIAKLVDAGFGSHTISTMPAAIEHALANPTHISPAQENLFQFLEQQGVIKRPEGGDSPSEAIAKAMPSIDQDTMDALEHLGFSPSDYQNFFKVPEPKVDEAALADAAEKKQWAQAKKATKKALELAQQEFFKGLVRDPKALGMSPKQYAGYAVRLHKAFDDLADKLWQQTYAKVQKQYNSDWKKAWEANFNPTMDEIMSEPVMALEHALRFSQKEIDDELKDSVVKNEVFYHGSQRWDIGTEKNPQFKKQSYKVISFSTSPEFANDWISGNEPNLSWDDYGHGKIIYVVQLNLKNILDPSDPAKVEAAARWLAEFDDESTYSWAYIKKKFDAGDSSWKYALGDLGLQPEMNDKTKELVIQQAAKKYTSRLKNYAWVVIERPDMWAALGFDAGYMKENPTSALNIAIADPEKIFFRYRQRVEAPHWRLDPALKEAYPKHLWEHLPKSLFSKEHSRPVQQIAAEFKFDSPEEMLESLSNFELQRGKTPFRKYVTDLIKGETRQRTLAQVGDILHPDRIREDAQALFSSPQAIDLLIPDLKAIADKLGEPISKEMVIDKAHENFQQFPVKQARNLTNYEGAIVRWGNKTEEYLVGTKPDLIKAFDAKQKQVMNVQYLAEAHELLKLYRRWTGKFADYAKHAAKPGIDQDFLDVIHSELAKHGYDVPTTNRDYALFLQEELKAGEVGLLPEEPIPTKPIEELTVEEFQALVDRIENLEKLGRAMLVQTIKGRDIARDEIAAEMKERAPVVPYWIKDHSNEVAPKASAAELWNLNTSKPLAMARYLDNYDPNGPWHRTWIWGLRDAHGVEMDFKRRVMNVLHESMAALPSKVKAQWMDYIPAGHGLMNPSNGQELKLTYAHVLGIYLNSRNDINRWHLEQGGWGWKKAAYEAVFERYLPPESKAFADKVLEHLNEMWGDVARVEKQMTGVAPERQHNYFPLRPESYWSDKLKNQELGDTTWEAFMRDAITPNSHIKRRTWTQYPVSLDWTQTLFDHYNKVGKRLAYGPWVQNMNRLLRDPRVLRIVKDVMGPAGLGEIKDSIRRAVGYRLLDPRAISVADGFWRGARERTYMVQAGLNMKVFFEHISAFPQSASLIGAKWVVGGAAYYMKNPMQAIHESHELSTYMRDRAEEIDRELRDIQADAKQFTIKNKTGLEKALEAEKNWERRSAANIIQFANHYVVAQVTWHGARLRALSEGMPMEQAIEYANNAVAFSHGSGAEMDMARIQAGSETHKLLMMYFNYRNVQWNLKTEMLRRARLAMAGNGGRGGPPPPPEGSDGEEAEMPEPLDLRTD